MAFACQDVSMFWVEHGKIPLTGELYAGSPDTKFLTWAHPWLPSLSLRNSVLFRIWAGWLIGNLSSVVSIHPP